MPLFVNGFLSPSLIVNSKSSAVILYNVSKYFNLDMFCSTFKKSVLLYLQIYNLKGSFVGTTNSG